jgi:hypothetical protein
MQTSLHEIVGDLMPGPHALPGGVTIGQVAAATGAVTTARISVSAIRRRKGREFPVYGDGLVDAGRAMRFLRLVTDGQPVDVLTVGRERFQRLSAGRQQATGKEWLRSPVENPDIGDLVLAAMPYAASCTGASEEILAGEQVHRCSFVVKPRGPSLLARLGMSSPPPVAELYAALRREGYDRVFLDVWLASDRTLRQVRLHMAALELALLDGRTSVVQVTADYWDFGVQVDLAAPPADQVLSTR